MSSTASGWTAARLTQALEGNGRRIVEHRDVAHGTQLRCADEAIINVYSSGKIVIGGKPGRGLEKLPADTPAAREDHPATLASACEGVAKPCAEMGLWRLLEAHGWKIAERRPIQNGVQLRTTDGGIVSLYSTGKTAAGGTSKSELELVLASCSEAARDARQAKLAAGDSYTTTPAMIQTILASFPLGAVSPEQADRERQRTWHAHASPDSIPF